MSLANKYLCILVSKFDITQELITIGHTIIGYSTKKTLYLCTSVYKHYPYKFHAVGVLCKICEKPKTLETTYVEICT